MITGHQIRDYLSTEISSTAIDIFHKLWVVVHRCIQSDVIHAHSVIKNTILHKLKTVLLIGDLTRLLCHKSFIFNSLIIVFLSV